MKNIRHAFLMIFGVPLLLMVGANNSFANEKQEELVYQQKEVNLNGDFFDRTFLLDMRQSSELSQKIDDIRYQSYETAFGEKVSFEKWYKTRWTDFRVLWLTNLDKNNGVIWGVSTGEYGEKYKIQPAIILGFVSQIDLSKNAKLTFQATFVPFGGMLKEKSCLADYGQIGGVQRVNCRLAATELEPKETLKFLFNEKNKDDNKFFIKFTYVF